MKDLSSTILNFLLCCIPTTHNKCATKTYIEYHFDSRVATALKKCLLMAASTVLALNVWFRGMTAQVLHLVLNLI